MLYLLPPAGFPISFADILKIIKARANSEKYSEMFKTKIAEHTGAKHCFLFNLGRTSLYHILKALIELSDSSKTDVVIPSYTCFTVAAPIARLGLKIRPVDIDPMTMDFDYEKLSRLDFEKVLAIVPSSLFGIISDWDKLLSIKQHNDIYLIDDAAQAMGSCYHDKPAGSFGDAGIFSLDRGKPLSTYLGGLMVTNDDEIADRVKKAADDLKLPGIKDELMIVIKIILYAMMLNARLFWLPNKIPFLKLGQTFFDEQFNMGLLSDLQSCAGAVMFSKLDSFNAIRVKNAKAICDGLSKDDRYRIPGYSQTNCPVYLRLPILARNKQERDWAIAALGKRGIKASAMYPSTINQIEGIEKYLAGQEGSFEGAQTVVDRLFTLPTHPYVRSNDIEKIIDCLTIR